MSAAHKLEATNLGTHLRPGSQVHLDEWITPDVTDERGLLRPGKILEWMDVTGSLAAARHSRRPVVTASIDAIELSEAITVGSHVTMTARVAYTSERSMGVSVSLAHGMPGDPSPRHCVEAYMTFVAVDAAGRTMPVPPLVPETPTERALFAEGQLRREFRRQRAAGQLATPSPGGDPLAGAAEAGRPHFGGAGGRIAEFTHSANELAHAIGLPRELLSDRLGQLLARELLRIIPPTLKMPWERREANPRARLNSYVHKIEPVRAGTLNFHNTLYGGTLMRWLETAGALSARAYASGAAMRLAGLHGLNFIRGVERDRFVHIRSMVVHTNSESLTVLVNVHAEDPIAATYEETLRAFLTYVPIDSGVRIAAVECLGDEDRALFAEVAQRLALQRSLPGRLAKTAS